MKRGGDWEKKEGGRERRKARLSEAGKISMPKKAWRECRKERKRERERGLLALEPE